MIDTPKEAATGDKAARDLMLSELLQVCSKAPWSFAPKIGECWAINDAEGDSFMGHQTYYPWTPDNINDWKLIALAPTIAAELIKERAVNAKLLEALKRADKDLFACQFVINLVGGFDPAYVRDSLETLKIMRDAIKQAEEL
jgi:hypothetical protein